MDSNDNIKEILARAESGTRIEEGEDGSVEFEFTDSSGVVFEDATVEKPLDSENETENGTAPDLENTALQDSLAEESVTLEGAQTAEEKGEKSSGEEFELPDVFNIVEESEVLWREETAGIMPTYVPRFTEVSENYRMRGAKREMENAAGGIKVESIDGVSSSDGTDPTAELGNTAENVQLINLEGEKKAEEETKTVYKFPTEAPAPSAPKIRTLEDEVRDINELMSHTDGERPEESTATEASCENSVRTESLDVTNEAPAEPIPTTISDSAIREANRGLESPPDVVRNDKKTTELAAVREDNKPKGREFSAPPQRDAFKDRFLDQLLSIRVRLIVASVLTLLVLVFENLGIFGVDLFAALKIPKYTGAPAILDLELAVCIFILAIPEMIVAVVQLIRGRVSSEISVILSLVVITVYSITVFALKLPDYPLFGFLFAVHVVAALFAAYLKKQTDFSSFKLISNKEKKKALTVSETKRMTMENLALDGAVDSYKSKTVTAVRTAFVSEFFKRCGDAAEKNATTLTMMGISSAAALVCGGVAYFLDSGLSSFVTASSLVFLMAMPAFSVLTNKFVYSHAAAALKKEGAAIIGQGALSEYADSDVMIFDDVEIFGEEDVKLRNFSGDMTKGMRQMCALFSALGGPLDKIFSSALDRKCSPATGVTVKADGISGTVDGHVILAGGESFMRKQGARFAEESIRFMNTGKDSTKIMYAAEDGVIYAGFRISYSFTESFTMILPSLREEKIVPLIVTRDPNVNNDLMKTLTMGGDSIRVLKKTDISPATEKIERRAAAGIVTVSENASPISALLLAKRSVALTARLALTEIMALGVGAALGIALSLGGMTEAPTAALGMWQLLWCVGVGFLSFREYRN